MLKFGSDISKLINRMSVLQRKDFYELIKRFRSNGLDEQISSDILAEIESINNYEKTIAEKERSVMLNKTTIPKENWGVHITHCCSDHGCKYGDIDCPVAIDLVKQKYKCEDCETDDTF